MTIRSPQTKISLELNFNRSYTTTELLNLVKNKADIPRHDLSLLKSRTTYKGGNRFYFVLPIVKDFYSDWMYKVYYVADDLQIKTSNNIHFYIGNERVSKINNVSREDVARGYAKALSRDNRQWVKGYNSGLKEIVINKVHPAFFDGWSSACSKPIDLNPIAKKLFKNMSL